MSKATETENHACTLSGRAKKKSLKARPAKCKGRAPTARFNPRISVFCFVVWQPLLHGFSRCRLPTGYWFYGNIRRFFKTEIHPKNRRWNWRASRVHRANQRAHSLRFRGGQIPHG